MHYKISLILLLFSFSLFGQETGKVIKETHSIKFLRSDNIYTCVYTDVNSKNNFAEKSFSFPVLKTIQKIILDGFRVKNDHQSIIQINNSIIVRFEFRTINGRSMFKIRQNNFQKKIFGTSAFISENDIRKNLSKVSDNQLDIGL
jgi:hypothetical protein